MILRTLKTNDYRAWVYMVVFAALVGAFSVVFRVNHEDVFINNPFWFLFRTSDPALFGSLWIKAAGVLLLLGNVILFDYVVTSQELVEKNNRIPAFLMGLYFAFPLQENPLHPQLFAQLLLTFSYQLFISTYRIEKSAPRIFDGAFCLSCAVILYPHYWMFFALGFIALAVLRTFNAREYGLVLIGLGLPYLFYYTLLFLCDQSLQKPVEDIINSFRQPSMPAYFTGSFPVNFISILVALFAGIYFLTSPSPGKMKTQKALTIFLWMLVPCLAAIFITRNHYVFTAQMAVMPLSLFAGIYFGNAKRRILAEVLALLLIALVLFSLMQHAGQFKI